MLPIPLSVVTGQELQMALVVTPSLIGNTSVGGDTLIGFLIGAVVFTIFYERKSKLPGG
jgi:hypothetical protein